MAEGANPDRSRKIVESPCYASGYAVGRDVISANSTDAIGPNRPARCFCFGGPTREFVRPQPYNRVHQLTTVFEELSVIRPAKRLLLAAVCCAAALFTTHAARAQDLLQPSSQKPVPIAVVTLSSVERVLENMDYMFASVDRPELSDLISAQLVNVRDLKGIDRNRPLGAMIFLKPGIIPSPEVVGFIPTDNFEELLQTMSIGPGKPAKVPDRENRYSIPTPGRPIFFEQVGKDVMIVANEDLLDGELPDPATLTAGLTGRYDLAAQLKVNTIPLGMRNVLLDFLRAAMEAEMQQRDDEIESSYRVRKAASSGNLRFIEQLLLNGDSLTLGLDVSPELKTLVVEFDMAARPGSEFAKWLSDSGGKTSYFRPLQKTPAVLSVSSSTQLDPKSIENLREIITEGQKFIEIQLQEQEATKDKTLRLSGLFAALNATVESGQLDGFFRVQRAESGQHSLLGGVRVMGGEQAAQSIGDILQLVGELEPGDVSVELNATEHEGVTFHRVIPTRQDPMSQRIFGENWAMYFGAGERTLWFVLGGDEALPAVRAAIDQVVDPAAQRDLAGTAPFQFSMSMSQWIQMWTDPDRQRFDEFLETMTDNFAKGQDRLMIDMTPREDGMRYRFRLEEGFIRAMGLGITRQIDESTGNGF